MKHSILFLLTFLLFQPNSIIAQENYRRKISSPDHKTQLQLMLNSTGEISYELSFRGTNIIDRSPLGLTINGRNTGTGLQITSHSQKSFSEKIKWPLGENAMIDNTYNELLLNCKSGDYKYVLQCRLFNGSLAFRYVFPEQATSNELKIEKENTAFNLTMASKIYQYHHESVFTPVYTDSLTTTCDFPATLENEKYYLSIGEADNRNYTKAELQKGTEQNSLSVAFPRDVAVIFHGAFETPWRTVSISKTAIGLHQFSELFLKLATPAEVDPNTIVPGKLMRAQLNTQSGLDCIDLAKKLDFKYIMFDAGWYGPERALSSDPRVVIPAIDMPTVIEYGKRNGIGVILYVNYVGLRNHLDEILPLYKQWGIAGLKFGFIDGFSQKGLIWLSNAIKKVNDAGLLLNIHDNYKPTGLSRTYPYLLTQEGIRGDENSPDAFHNTTLPFTRYLAGAADFTYCFPNSKNNFSKNIKVSKAQQLALTVVYYSPLQAIFWYGQPQDYTNLDELEFFKRVPTVWDESRYLSGSIGKNISVARRKGDAWFIGNAAGFLDWTENLKLDFLDKSKKYRLTVFEDGENESITKRSFFVRKNDKMPVKIKGKGGQAILIEPVTNP